MIGFVLNSTSSFAGDYGRNGVFLFVDVEVKGRLDGVSAASDSSKVLAEIFWDNNSSVVIASVNAF